MKHYMTARSISALIFLLSIASIGQINAQTIFQKIDFESIPSDDLSDGLTIDNQFLNSNGVSFELEDGTFPRIAKVGLPATAFGTSMGLDTIINDYEIGSYFLTDDGILQGLTFSPLVISFSSPVDSVSAAIMDIDFGETFTIQINDQLDTVLSEIIFTDGDPNTGDGIATEWGFKRDVPDIYSIKIIGERTEPGAFGLGFDNLVFFQIDETNSTQDKLNDAINIYPNPSPGDITIQSPQRKSISSIELFDIRGMKLDFEMSSNSDETNIQCDYNGTVIAKIVIDNSVIIRKLMLN